MIKSEMEKCLQILIGPLDVELGVVGIIGWRSNIKAKIKLKRKKGGNNLA